MLRNEEHQISVPIQLVVKDPFQGDVYTNNSKKCLFAEGNYSIAIMLNIQCCEQLKSILNVTL